MARRKGESRAGGSPSLLGGRVGKWVMLCVPAGVILVVLLAGRPVAQTRTTENPSPAAVHRPRRLPACQDAPQPNDSLPSVYTEDQAAPPAIQQIAHSPSAQTDLAQGPVVPPPPAPIPRPPLRLVIPPLRQPEAPLPPDAVRLPFPATAGNEQCEIKPTPAGLSLFVRDTPVNKVLALLAQYQHWNIVCAGNVNVPVSLTLENVPSETALQAVLAIANCCSTQIDGVIYVTSIAAATRVASDIQGRDVRVFCLDFASATDVELAVKPMLSPIGQCAIMLSKAQDNRKTSEALVVQDVPYVLRTVQQYIEQVDRPPRQVLIEAHVLSIDLSNNDRCGVDLTALFDVLQHNMRMEMVGASVPSNAPAFLFSFDGHDLKFLLEALRVQNNAKTLASPKVLAVNGQQAKIQIGRKLGYLVTTTTETSTMQSVNFLDVGVILTVTPRISRDGQVVMHVQPEVSDGQINSTTHVPDSNTTQVETNVMLPDGRGMVIGGLIQEQDVEIQSKVPFLGDLWLIGRLFQRKETTKERKEIIVTLIPHVVPEAIACDSRHATEVMRTQTPLLQPDLQRAPRPWEPTMPDAVDNPIRIRDWWSGKHSPPPGSGEPGPAPGDSAPGEPPPYYGGQIIGPAPDQTPVPHVPPPYAPNPPPTPSPAG